MVVYVANMSCEWWFNCIYLKGTSNNYTLSKYSATYFAQVCNFHQIVGPVGSFQGLGQYAGILNYSMPQTQRYWNEKSFIILISILLTCDMITDTVLDKGILRISILNIKFATEILCLNIFHQVSVEDNFKEALLVLQYWYHFQSCPDRIHLQTTD